MPFSRFPAETLSFLLELRANNNHKWFRAHTRDYQVYCVSPAKEFVEAAGSAIKAFIPGIRAEPKVTGSIFRINRDIRYAKDDRPYKDYLDFWFWEGTRKEATSGLFARISPDFVGLGAGCHKFDRELLSVFHDATADPLSGSSLAETVAAIESKDYKIQGEHNKLPLRNYPAAGVAARFLRFNALFVHRDEPPEIAFRDGAMLSTALKHWRELAPLHRWITQYVQFHERLR